MRGRVPLLHHEKALVISTTLFREEDYDTYLKEPMARMIDDWGLRYPGIKKVEHVYFYRAILRRPRPGAGTSSAPTCLARSSPSSEVSRPRSPLLAGPAHLPRSVRP
jgi:hypothetical protein